MRKRAAVTALALFFLLLSGCSKANETPTLRIGVALYQQDDTFIATIVQNLERLAKEAEQERSVKLNLSFAYGRGSQAAQNEQIDRFLNQGCDVISVNIVDRTAAAVLIDKAQAADVPIVFFNREPVEEDLRRWEGAYYVGLKAEQGGRLQGGIVRDAWEADSSALDRNGDAVLQYIMLEGEAGHQDSLLRTEYSIKTLTSAGIETEKLANDTANWQRGLAAIRVAARLEQFGDSIEVIFANNDDMALGAIDACLAAGMSVEELPFIVGVDATPPALEAIESGTLKGTVLNDAAGQAQGVMQLCLAFMDGVEAGERVTLEDEKYVWLPYKTVTKVTIAAGIDN